MREGRAMERDLENGEDWVEIYVDVLAETEYAILVGYGGNSAWVPIQYLGGDSEAIGVGESGCIYIPEWLAIDTELV